MGDSKIAIRPRAMNYAFTEPRPTAPSSSRLAVTFGSLLCVVAATGPLLAANSDERERIARIECLIELLASKNAAPTVVGDAAMGDDQTLDFPKSYDRSLQVPVYLAVKELLAEDEAAMDLLLAHKNDDRYSFSVNSYKDYNLSVSRACLWIAEQKLSCYEPEIAVITRSQFGVYPDLSPFKGSGASFES